MRGDGGLADLQSTKHSKSNEGRQGKNGGVKADYTRERLSYVRQGRPILRWEACKEIREDSRREGSWKKKKIDRGGWKRLSDDAVEKLRRARQTP